MPTSTTQTERKGEETGIHSELAIADQFRGLLAEAQRLQNLPLFTSPFQELVIRYQLRCLLELSIQIIGGSRSTEAALRCLWPQSASASQPSPAPPSPPQSPEQPNSSSQDSQ